MKAKTVPSTWMQHNGLRLDSGPYLAGAFEAQMILKSIDAPKELLAALTKGGPNGIYHAGREGRNYVDDPQFGIPFMGSTAILEADLSTLPLLSEKQIEENPLFVVREEWTLITRSGTVGRMAFVRPDMHGLACSEHVMRVVPNSNRIRPGYLYAVLSSRFGIPQVISGVYGAIIQHIEPRHIMDLQIPRLDDSIEERVHNYIVEAAQLRSEHQTKVIQATNRFFESVGLRDITPVEWHRMGPDLSFSAEVTSSTSLRAINFNPRYRQLIEQLKSTDYLTLADVCDGGRLSSGPRFKRIDADPDFGVKLIGQKEIFWLEPEGRWISPHYSPEDIFVPDETILIAAQGTLGENEVFCRAALITGPWTEHAYSQHFLRVFPGPSSNMSGALLFAFMRSETVFRCLRSLSVGSKQQDIHRDLLADFPVPIPDENDRTEIEELVRNAYRARHEASHLEQAAINLVETTIQEAS